MIEYIKAMNAEVIIGIILIIINFPLGWIGLIWFIHLAKVKCKRSYYFLGIGMYILSWAALLVGTYLTGEYYARAMFAKYRVFIIEGTAIIVIALIFLSQKLIKKASKINEKCLIDKETEKI